jgi:hypothetical protein
MAVLNESDSLLKAMAHRIPSPSLAAVFLSLPPTRTAGYHSAYVRIQQQFVFMILKYLRYT